MPSIHARARLAWKAVGQWFHPSRALRCAIGYSASRNAPRAPTAFPKGTTGSAVPCITAMAWRWLFLPSVVPFQTPPACPRAPSTSFGYWPA